jgi:hypothetical protein
MQQSQTVTEKLHKYTDKRRAWKNMYSTVHSESLCALRLQYVDLVVSIEVAIEVCNRLIQFLLIMVCGHHFQHLL